MTDPLKAYTQQFPAVAGHWRQLPAPALRLPAGRPSRSFRPYWLALPMLALLWLGWPSRPPVAPVPQAHQPLAVKMPRLKVQVRLPGSLPARPTGRLPSLSAPRPQGKPRLRPPSRVG